MRSVARQFRVSLSTVQLWVERGEKGTVESSGRVYPGLYVSGMAANAVHGAFRMRPIFGGMLLSGRKVAKLILEELA
jgi:thiamine thiazole synthase